MLLPPPQLVLLQEDLRLLLRLLQELQLGQLALSLVLEGPQSLEFLLLGLSPLFTLLALLATLQLQVFVKGGFAFDMQPDGRLNGCYGDSLCDWKVLAIEFWEK